MTIFTVVEFYNHINLRLVSARLNATRYRNTILESRELPDDYMAKIDIYGDIFDNVNKQTLIIYLKTQYKSLLVECVYLTNIVNKTLTATNYEQVKEDFDDMLQMLFKCFGMATHQKWSSRTTNDYYSAQHLYDLAIKIQSQ